MLVLTRVFDDFFRRFRTVPMLVRELETRLALNTTVKSTGPLTRTIMYEALQPWQERTRKLYDTCRISSCVLACTRDAGWEQHAILRRLG